MNPLSWFDPDDPYPESDGEPMAENTEQYGWLVLIKENLEVLFADDPDVFIAGDLLWYPHPDRRVTGPMAPDVMVAFGRPKGRRGCYKQWEEGGIAPQVVFEIRSPANSARQLAEKLAFYDTWGVEEYYLYDPDTNALEIWLREPAARADPAAAGRRLARVSHIKGWTSPRLGIRFALTPETLRLFDPAGRPFLNSLERAAAERAAEAAAEQARAALAAARAEAERERERAERLAERLRALGIEP